MKNTIHFFARFLLFFGGLLLSFNASSSVKERNQIYYEGFNFMWEPDGWTFAQLGSSLQGWEQALPGYQGPGAKHTYTDSEALYSNAWMISPAITLPANAGLMLSFWEKNEHLPYGAGAFSGVYISNGQGSAAHADFVQVYESSSPLSAYVLKQIDISAYAGQTIFVAFVYKGAYSHDWYLDEVKINEVNLITTTLTMEPYVGSGSVTPAPGSYEYTFEEGNPPTENLSALPALGYTFNGWSYEGPANQLHPRTTILMDQDYSVQAAFSPYADDVSLFWHKYGFQNMGANSTVDAETNLEGLDNFSNSSIDQITKLVAYGWASKYDGGFVEWVPENTEPFIVRFYDAPQNALPNSFGEAISTQNINAKVYLHGEVQFGSTLRTIYKVEIDLLTPVALQSGWISLQINGNAGAEGWFIWIAGQQGNGNNLSFRRNRTNNTFIVNSYDLHVEVWGNAVEIPNPPSCVSPVFPMNGATNIGYPVGAHPVTSIEWSSSPDADGYILYFGEQLPEEGIDLGDMSSYTPSNLSYGVTYQWMVVPYNEDGTAEGCPVSVFTTIEDPTITPPFSVYFDPSSPNWLPPSGWDDRKYGKLTENSILADGSTNQWIYQNFAHITGNGRAAKARLSESANPPHYNWFISPPINLPADEHDNYLYFDLAITLNNSTVSSQLKPGDKIHLVVSTDGGGSWPIENSVFSLSGENGDLVQAGGETFWVSLANFHGIIKVGFYVERETAAGVIDVFVGNIKAYEAYNVELIGNPVQGGVLQGAGLYAVGQDVTIVASPNPGYTFINWTNSQGDVIGEAQQYQFDMPGSDVSYYANFQLIDYTISVVIEPEEGGDVTISPLSDFYNINDEVSLVATANDDFVFVEWQLDGTSFSSQPAIVFTMPAANVLITAKFASTLPQIFSLTLVSNPETAGVVSGSGQYEEGSQVSINAVANEGFVFTNWTDNQGNILSLTPNFQLVMPSMDLLLRANFNTETSIEAFESCKFILFPNPASDYIQVNSEDLIKRVVILDLAGKTMIDFKCNEAKPVIQTVSLMDGVYIVRVWTENGFKVGKINIVR